MTLIKSCDDEGEINKKNDLSVDSKQIKCKSD